MKPTQIAELLANIRKTFVSFFSILMFVALGVGIFVGISWTSPALENAADKVFDEGKLYNFQILYPYGLTDDDVKEIAASEAASDVEATRQSFEATTVGGEKYVVKVQTAGSRINIPIVMEGALPAKPDELLLKASAAKELGLGVGDTLRFEHNADDAADKDGMKYLTTSSFKIAGLAESPEYLAYSAESLGQAVIGSGKIDAIAWVPAGAFDGAAFRDGYPVVNVRCESLQGLGTFSEDYAKAGGEAEKLLAATADTLAERRFNDLHGTAQKQIDEGEQKLAEGERQAAEGEKQIAEGNRQLEEAQAALDQKRTEGQEQLDALYQQLLGFESLKSEGEEKLAQARSLLDQGHQGLALVDELKNEAASIASDMTDFEHRQAVALANNTITKEQYDAALDAKGREVSAPAVELARQAGVTLPAIDHTNFLEAAGIIGEAGSRIEDTTVVVDGQAMTVREARTRVSELEQQVAAGESELATRSAQLDEGWSRYYQGRQLLESETAAAEQKIVDGKAQIAELQKKLDEGKATIAEKSAELDSAKDALAGLKKYVCRVVPRAYNGGIMEATTFSGVTTNLSFSMAALFVIVGLLVSYSAVSRIVHEQVTQIGTKKALGLYGREITASFLAYSALAVIIGAVVGTAVGVTLVEGIIGNVLGERFFMGGYPPYFGLPLMLAVTALELVLVLGATYLACRSVLRENAVELLKGEKPPTATARFYEKWRVWERLPLLTQTMVNNCVNDKRRVFSTVVGVAGCTALIVTAITLNNDVLKSYDHHYESVYGFNAVAFADTAVDGSIESIEEALQEEGALTAQAWRQASSLTLPDSKFAPARVIVPADEEAFAKVYHIRSVSGGAEEGANPALGEDGVWVSQSYRDHIGAKVGDELTIDTGDGAVHKFPIAGFYEFYLTNHEVVMGKELYEKEFGTPLSPNVVLADTGEMDVAEASVPLSSIDGFIKLVDDKADAGKNFSDFASVSNTVVLVYLMLSVLMAIVVLLNLNVMFIEEKKRELIVLMINGFSTKDAKRYIYNDTIVLTAIGIVAGIVVGCLMGAVTVGAVEPSTASFIRGIDPPAVLIGIAGSAVLAVVMSVIALRRIPRFDLTDINKF